MVLMFVGRNVVILSSRQRTFGGGVFLFDGFFGGLPPSGVVAVPGDGGGQAGAEVEVVRGPAEFGA